MSKSTRWFGLTFDLDCRSNVKYCAGGLQMKIKCCSISLWRHDLHAHFGLRPSTVTQAIYVLCIFCRWMNFLRRITFGIISAKSIPFIIHIFRFSFVWNFIVLFVLTCFLVVDFLKTSTKLAHTHIHTHARLATRFSQMSFLLLQFVIWQNFDSIFVLIPLFLVYSLPKSNDYLFFSRARRH